MVMLALSFMRPDLEPSALSSWYLRVSPLIHVLATVFIFPQTLHVEAAFVLPYVMLPSLLLPRLASLHPDLGLQPLALILTNIASAALMLAMGAWRSAAAAAAADVYTLSAAPAAAPAAPPPRRRRKDAAAEPPPQLPPPQQRQLSSCPGLAASLSATSAAADAGGGAIHNRTTGADGGYAAAAADDGNAAGAADADASPASEPLPEPLLQSPTVAASAASLSASGRLPAVLPRTYLLARQLANGPVAGSAAAAAPAGQDPTQIRYARITRIHRTVVKIHGVEPEQVAAGWQERVERVVAASGLQLESVYLRRGCCELVVDAVVWPPSQHAAVPPPPPPPEMLAAAAAETDGPVSVGANEVAIDGGDCYGDFYGGAGNSMDIGELIRALQLPYDGDVELELSYDLDGGAARTDLLAWQEGPEVCGGSGSTAEADGSGGGGAARWPGASATSELCPWTGQAAASGGVTTSSSSSAASGGCGGGGSGGAYDAWAIIAVRPHVLCLAPPAPAVAAPHDGVSGGAAAAAARLWVDLWCPVGGCTMPFEGDGAGGGARNRPNIVVRSQGLCIPLSASLRTVPSQQAGGGGGCNGSGAEAEIAVGGGAATATSSEDGGAGSACAHAAQLREAEDRPLCGHASADSDADGPSCIGGAAIAATAAEAAQTCYFTADVCLHALPPLPGLLLVEVEAASAGGAAARRRRPHRRDPAASAVATAAAAVAAFRDTEAAAEGDGDSDDDDIAAAAAAAASTASSRAWAVAPVLAVDDPWVAGELGALLGAWRGTAGEMRDMMMDLGCFMHNYAAAVRPRQQASSTAAASSAVRLPPLLRLRLLDLGSHLLGWFLGGRGSGTEEHWPHTAAWLQAALADVASAGAGAAPPPPAVSYGSCWAAVEADVMAAGVAPPPPPAAASDGGGGGSGAVWTALDGLAAGGTSATAAAAATWEAAEAADAGAAPLSPLAAAVAAPSAATLAANAAATPAAAAAAVVMQSPPAGGRRDGCSDAPQPDSPLKRANQPNGGCELYDSYDALVTHVAAGQVHLM
ncbi:hypothetical protein GPECTOR_13g863 [Gonium pectorale]|uniref:Uncharacterized protein n=1 Tax=Gonium pectorale TaxID=33097 RepID=A0A150GNJ3_GONPE|nr:hypothetical protein GPECTOR_13g863 [Gonium pectorale]|eukprot:KXZ51374.1 hypothetical protein GPECTOR_13g863 [Gonium pectorale]